MTHLTETAEIVRCLAQAHRDITFKITPQIPEANTICQNLQTQIKPLLHNLTADDCFYLHENLITLLAPDLTNSLNLKPKPFRLPPSYYNNVLLENHNAFTHCVENGLKTPIKQEHFDMILDTLLHKTQTPNSPFHKPAKKWLESSENSLHTLLAYVNESMNKRKPTLSPYNATLIVNVIKTFLNKQNDKGKDILLTCFESSSTPNAALLLLLDTPMCGKPSFGGAKAKALWHQCQSAHGRLQFQHQWGPPETFLANQTVPNYHQKTSNQGKI